MFPIIINFLLFNEIFAYITFNIYTYKDKEKDSNINSISENIIYTYLNIGFPPQKIAAFILPNESGLNFEGSKCEIKSDFILEKSTNYVAQEYSRQYKTNITLSYLITDKFEFIFNETGENIYIEPIKYIYKPNNYSQINNNLYSCAFIGLSTVKYDFYEPVDNIIIQLRNLKAIKKYCYFIIYDNLEKGQGKLIIGDYPDIYEPNKYKKYQLKTLYSLNINSNYNWKFQFTSINFEYENKKFSYDNLDSILDISSGLILSPEKYFNEIFSYFFEEKINKGLCRVGISEKKLKFIICNSLNIIKNFPVLYFKHSFLLYTFELNYNDLFKKISEEEYVFLISCGGEFKNTWKLGTPFLKKYLFFYNYEEKYLGFYNPNINEEGILINDKQKDEKVINNTNNNKINIFILILIIFSFLIFVIFFIIGRRYYKKRKNIINKINNKDKNLIRELIDTDGNDEKNIN